MRLCVAAWLFVLGACTRDNPRHCDSDAECEAPTPFCDVAGEFAESEFNANLCIPRPAGCSVERCGCDAGEGLACTGDQLTTCNADEHSSSVQTCALGCATEPRCTTFEPSNGLGGAFNDSAHEPDVLIPDGAAINTDNGEIRVGATTLPVRSVLIGSGSSAIRVYLARSFTMGRVSASGAIALAFVSQGPIVLKGVFEARAEGTNAGPGAQELPATCVGGALPDATQTWTGGGGGGNAVKGGAGGGWAVPGGDAGQSFAGITLAGGCRGGTVTNLSGAVLAAGGGGGGAVQLVSNARVSFEGALVDLGGGGGGNGGGGGSGGLLVIEAPTVTFTGTSAGIVANGGAGGGCGSTGADGTATTAVAVAPTCTNHSAGNGGTMAVAPQPGYVEACGSFCNPMQPKGGGGGSVGRAIVITADGNFSTTGAPLFGAVIEKRKLTLK